MALLNTKERYGTLSIGLHWLMLVLLIGVYACIELHGYFPKGSAIRSDLKTWHFYLGLTVFLLVMVRLGLRWSAPEPRIVPDILIWQKWLAKLLHYALYVFMIGMPLAGYFGLSAAGKDIYFYGMLLPNWMETNKALAKTIINTHETVGTIGYYLIGLHAIAALFHHYVQGDNTLRRMWMSLAPGK